MFATSNADGIELGCNSSGPRQTIPLEESFNGARHVGAGIKRVTVTVKVKVTGTVYVSKSLCYLLAVTNPAWTVVSAVY